MLVFERLDIFDSNVEKLQELAKTVSVDMCSCSDYFDYTDPSYRAPGMEGKNLEALINERCCWPVLHGDIREMVQSATYRRVMVGNMEEEPTQTRAGRRMAERVEKLNVKAVMDVVKTRATNVVTFLHSGLSEVYSGTDRAQIESIRVLLNLKFFVRAVERSGSANIAAIHFKKWLDSAKLLQTDLIIRIPMEEVRMQFRCFLRKLEELAPTLNNLENKEIFSLLLHPRHRHFEGFETVLAVLANASVAMGLESVVESWVSVMEHHNNPRRPLTQERLEHECMVAINGPDEVHCDSVVTEALVSYWGRKAEVGNRKGHWVRRDRDIKQYAVSEALDNLVQKLANVPFMV